MDTSHTRELGAFLRARREQLPPEEAPADAPPRKRRTPGARRSEIAARAKISVEWYTRLEQGRSGRPSTHVLDAICDALRLRSREREHAFLLAYGGSAAALHEDLTAAAGLHLQRLVDRFAPWPAYIKSPSWDVLLWNTPATELLTDYGALAPAERNILRMLFLRPETRRRIKDWEQEAKLAVATFRTELVRWGDRSGRTAALIRELTEESVEFRTLWKLNEVGHLGEGVKTLLQPDGTSVLLHYESLSLDAYPGLGLVTYTPVADDDPLPGPSPHMP
jgi:transcriptional regulator with XRE-family HTH domain